MLFRDNNKGAIDGKHVVLLLATTTTGETIRRAMEVTGNRNRIEFRHVFASILIDISYNFQIILDGVDKDTSYMYNLMLNFTVPKGNRIEMCIRDR